MNNYNYDIKGKITAKTIDEAVDILYLALEDITCNCTINVFNKKIEVVCK